MTVPCKNIEPVDLDTRCIFKSKKIECDFGNWEAKYRENFQVVFETNDGSQIDKKALKSKNDIDLDSTNNLLDTLINNNLDSINVEIEELSDFDTTEAKKKILEEMFNPEKSDFDKSSKSTKSNEFIEGKYDINYMSKYI